MKVTTFDPADVLIIVPARVTGPSGAITTVRAAVGKEHGYTLRVTRFTSLGYSIPDFRIHVFDLAEASGSTASSATVGDVVSQAFVVPRHGVSTRSLAPPRCGGGW